MSGYSNHTERELLETVAAGDEMAFNHLMRQYANLLASFVYRLTRNREQTEEIVQDTFLKIWQTRESLSQVENFTAYLYVISRNQALNALRSLIREKRRLGQWTELQVVSSTDPGHDTGEERLGLLEKAIAQLPPQQKEAWLLSRREGLKYREIATRMQLSRETVKKYIQYASLSITRYLEEHSELVLYGIIVLGT